jgi:hypothetical protein
MVRPPQYRTSIFFRPFLERCSYICNLPWKPHQTTIVSNTATILIFFQKIQNTTFPILLYTDTLPQKINSAFLPTAIFFRSCKHSSMPTNGHTYLLYKKRSLVTKIIRYFFYTTAPLGLSSILDSVCLSALPKYLPPYLSRLYSNYSTFVAQ